MKQFSINTNEAGQRFDKYLFKLLKEAPSSFVYKMLRKKNIVLNGKKDDGKSILKEGDVVKVFLADDTFDKFSGVKSNVADTFINVNDGIDFNSYIIYEDGDVILINKPSGVLSQKAEDKDVSINEMAISYMLSSKMILSDELNTFKPSIVNRLDRNTSGMIVFGKSLKGIQILSEMFKERSVDKYYLTIVEGVIDKEQTITGKINKDEKNNKVVIVNEDEKTDKKFDYIKTGINPIAVSKDNKYSLLQIKLYTGKTHQIRAHLSSINHPIIGDGKYGNVKVNDYFRNKYKLRNQLLHSYKLKFYDCDLQVKDKEYTAKIPGVFAKILKGEFDGNVEF
ncbi:23S rRNA pseudouridine955/2504/2580 synthase [Eubacterium uniforme]|uniref:RNA pseudouridylate synthase n=1 Tax=Eubacterium uniforme TaxID=39495 RepID=A0A1T4W647_9FIRM|nr:RluA family pseudouridine synthase [Eubacterium uniforme]SKA72528.1 23S rRNA pseudouridine955/2504/2580 synthase [Eubacterium uniforme]